ncbi:transposase [Paraburkholderia sp. C35]|uniref:IS66-like element accessory protein TnpA n=1 Tax=Paraburkholderia sp. C35 TaxID=2126993 RepID=UPI000D687215|nr:transposase [Paraburkholderia sp. C35]
MNTIESESLPERRRQRYSEEFKARVVATCQGVGVSVAAVALEHRLNANLLRRWIDQAEGRLPRRPLGRPPATPPSLPAFVPVALTTPSPQSSEIRIDEAWLAVDPLDMRAGFDTALARVVKVFGAALQRLQRVQGRIPARHH